MSETNNETNEQNSSASQKDTKCYELPFSLTPAHILAAASLSLCVGTYVGFKRQLKIVEKEAAQHAAQGTEEALITISKESKSVARRALGLGTLVSVGGFGLFGAVAFYASGFRTMDEAVSYLHEWGPRKRTQFEKWIGIDLKRNDGNPDVEATRNMTSDEELEYYRTKYFSDEGKGGQAREGAAAESASQQ